MRLTIDRIWWLSCAAFVLAIPALSQSEAAEAPPAPAPEAAPAAPADQRLEELDQKVRVLERRAEVAAEQEAEKAKGKAQVTAGKDGFGLRSADGDFVLKIRGYVQLDGRYFQDDPRPASDTFVIRRARPILEGTLYGRFDFRIMPDFGGGTTVLQDAYADARFTPAFQLRAGKYKPPVGLERLQSATDLLFVERALPTNLVPNRDLGVMLHGDLAGGRASYALGAFNGVPDGGNGDLDTNNGKDVAARLFFEPGKGGGGPLAGLGLGIAGSSGNQSGTAAAPNLPSFKTGGQATFFAFRSDTTAAGTAIAAGRHTRLSPQLYWYAGPFGVLAEYVESRQRVARAAAAADLQSDAWQVALSYVLGGKASYRGALPDHPYDPAARRWGAFELAARYHQLDVGSAAFPLFANPASAARRAAAWAAGVNWYLNRGLKLMLDYERTASR
jgi:phosphate-selective porin OprO/OprP